ncbi:hypothetical protein BH24CHL6_BH24CHL6_01410 [soil metagenome]
MSLGPSPFPPAPAEPQPSPGGHGLHPLSVGQLFGLSMRMYRFGWRPLLAAAALLLVPLYAAQTLVEIVVSPLINRWVTAWEQWLEEFERLATEPGFETRLPPLPDFPAGFWEAVLISLLVGVLGAVVGGLAMAAVIFAVGRIYEGSEASARDAVGRALRRAPSLIGAQLLFFVVAMGIAILGLGLGVALLAQGAGLLAFVGAVLLVSATVALVIVTVRWIFMQQAIMLEGRGAPDGLGRSWRLVGGSALRVLGYVLLVSVVVGLVGAIFVSIASLLVTGSRPPMDPLTIALNYLLAGAFTILATPFTTIYFTLLYFDIRWRRGESEAQLGQPGGWPYSGQPRG